MKLLYNENRYSRQNKVVGQGHQCFVVLWIEIADASEFLGIVLFRIVSLEDHDLIGLDAGRFVDRLRVEPFSAEVGFRPSDKECCCMLNCVEARKIEIAAIHDVDGPRFDDQLIEGVDIVNLPRGNDYDGWYVPMQIQEGVDLHRSFAFAERCPGKESQTQIDGCRIQDVNRLLQFDTEKISGIKGSRFRNEDLSELGINTPVPVLVGVGQCIAGDFSADSQMIQSGLRCPEAGLDISQTLSEGKLGKRHAEILVPAGEADHFTISVVPIDAFAKLVCGGG